ncbi:MAG: hypothetical protein ACFE9Q_17565 [Candidatus Hodarchaeota archaeon]
MKQYCGDIPIVMFANKVDLIKEDNFDKSPIQEVLKRRNFLGYYITSAKTGKGVYDAFKAIIEKLYSKYKTLSSEL